MMRKRSMVTQEELVNVHHSFVMKHISDSDGDGLVVTGTFVQYVFCSNEDLIESENNKNEEEEDGSDIKGVHFEYRFNDTSAEDEKYFVQYQGVEIQEHTDMGKLFKHSYYIKIPLALDVKLDCFPFRVISASLLVELTTFTTDDKKLRVRPDLMVHKRDKTNMFSIQPDLWREDSRSPMQQANDIMDQSENYDLVSPFPRVSYIYNSQKNYCPKFRVQFLMVQNGTKKLLEILVPMVLIAALNTFHVMGGEVTDIPDYTGNSANFALSVLIFLPTISSGTGHIQTLWRASNMYIITIILALALSSVPYEWVGFNHIASAGMILYWVSFLFPIINCLRYVRFVRHAKFHKAGAGMHFWASDDYSDSRNDPYDETQYDAKSSFVKVSEIVNDSDEQGLQLKAMDFRIRTVNKSQILEFASMEEIKARLIEEVMPLHIQKSDEEVMFI
ncbi:unnamed protein product [Cylindrotheca closterium]|uniref:Uncharacterized protein n=1 Tax=Cylindrotheca closterium TaxID=2856 RepID=A0AAD2JGM4_9STRA|nr:unnamed protein product [Cylindrotheca closterium]